MDIAHKVEETLVLYVVDEDIEATIHTHPTPIHTHRPFQRKVVQVAELVALPEVQSLDGHEQVHQFFIQPRRCRL